MDFCAELFGEVVVHPHVVVADKVVDFDAQIGQFAEFAQQAAIAFGNGLPIFKPEVKNIAQQVEFGDIGFDLVQPMDKMPFADQTCSRIGRSQVQIGCEVYIFTRIQAPRR